ncbi:MAG TPA: aromatic amino acid lyase, partial [Thermoanaerobaculia bacterium]
MKPITIDGNSLNLDDLSVAASGGAEISLTPDARVKMEASRAIVEKALAEGRTVYGVTTGFGVFSEVAIPPDKVLQLQRNLVLSHCAAVGDPYPVEVVRGMMLLRANALAKGFSGIRPTVVDRLLQMLNADVIPVIPSQGSVGASGDLAPLAHLAAALMGEGEVWQDRLRVPSRDAL